MQAFFGSSVPACVAGGSGNVDEGNSGNTGGSSDQPPFVVIVDNRTLSREGMAHLLESCHRFRVFAAASVTELLQGDIDLQEGVVLLSLGSRELGDAEVRNDIGLLSQANAAVRVVIVGDREDSHQVGEALVLGARGYIPTTLTARVVVEALRLVQAGGTFVPACAFSEALTQRRTERPEPSSNTAFNLSGLTPRQREVFDLLRRGKPNKIIAYELAMCESTVKVHVRQIMRKLQANNRTQAAFLAARVADQSAA